MSDHPNVPEPKKPSPYGRHGSDSEAADGPSATFQADAMGGTVIAYLITGPALFGPSYAVSELWLFWVAPIAGAVIGALIYNVLLKDE